MGVEQIWPTGVAGLDSLLRGGLPIGCLTVITGPTGSGKTVLAHQLARAAGQGAVYFVSHGRPVEALAARHAEPRPRYVDLGATSREAGLDGVLEAVAKELRKKTVSLAVVDHLGGLLAAGIGPGPAPGLLPALGELLWRGRVVGIACLGHEVDLLAAERVCAAATLVIALERGDQARPRRLRVVKYEGAGCSAAPTSFRLGPLGIELESGHDVPAPEPVTGLGASILGLFQTTRRATAAQIAELVGHDLATVEAALQSLVATGYLVADTTARGEPAYALPR